MKDTEMDGITRFADDETLEYIARLETAIQKAIDAHSMYFKDGEVPYTLAILRRAMNDKER